MSKMRTSPSGLAGAFALGLFLAGCGSFDTPSMPLKETLLGKPSPEPNLTENRPLIMPPRDAPLPVPGQAPPAAAPASTQAPAAPNQQNKQTASCANGQDCNSGWFSRLFGSSDDKKTQ